MTDFSCKCESKSFAKSLPHSHHWIYTFNTDVQSFCRFFGAVRNLFPNMFRTERVQSQLSCSDASDSCARWRPSSTNGSPWSQLKVVSLELGTLQGWLREDLFFLMRNFQWNFHKLSGSKFFIFTALLLYNSKQPRKIWMIESVLDHWSTRQGIAALRCDPWWRGTVWRVISSVIPCCLGPKFNLDRLTDCHQSPQRMPKDVVLQETLKKNMFRKGMVLISVIHLWQESKPWSAFEFCHRICI